MWSVHKVLRTVVSRAQGSAFGLCSDGRVSKLFALANLFCSARLHRCTLCPWTFCCCWQKGHEGQLSDEEEEEENDRSGSTKVTVGKSEGDAVPSSDKPSGSRGGRDPASPPHRDSNGAPPRASKGKRPYLTKIWNRRKSTGTVEVDPEAGGHREIEAIADLAGGATSAETPLSSRNMGGRTASAPVMVGPTPSKPWRKRRSADDSACTSPGTETTAETLEDLLPKGFEVGGGDDGDGGAAGGVGGSSLAAAAAATATISHPSMQSAAHGEKKVVGGDEKGPEGGHQRRGSGGVMTGPTDADIMSAPFLVARISDVGAELKDIMWSVKQTHFPHLKTAGSLQATVSGLTIELELDTQNLPRPRGRSRTTEGGDSDAEGAGDRSPASGGGGDRETPKGLRITSLRVSVRTVKVHFSHSALSAVYNLAASAFEVAVKRYVVESVEAAVRKSLTTLLAIVNNQMIEKWNILCKVGGGGGADTGIRAPRGNAVDKVLATSLLHHVVWAAGDGGGDNGGNTAAGVAGAKGATPPDQRTASRSSRGDSVGSGPSRALMVGQDNTIVDGEIGGGGGAGTPSARERSAKRSFRKRLLGSAGKNQSAEEMSRSRASSSSSLEPGSFSRPHSPSRADQQRPFFGGLATVESVDEGEWSSRHVPQAGGEGENGKRAQRGGENETPASIHRRRGTALPPCELRASANVFPDERGASSSDEALEMPNSQSEENCGAAGPTAVGMRSGKSGESAWVGESVGNRSAVA